MKELTSLLETLVEKHITSTEEIKQIKIDIWDLKQESQVQWLDK
jgi:hypothetical protein